MMEFKEFEVFASVALVVALLLREWMPSPKTPSIYLARKLCARSYGDESMEVCVRHGCVKKTTRSIMFQFDRLLTSG